MLPAGLIPTKYKPRYCNSPRILTHLTTKVKCYYSVCLSNKQTSSEHEFWLDK
jgi:hypothetical protein